MGRGAKSQVTPVPDTLSCLAAVTLCSRVLHPQSFLPLLVACSAAPTAPANGALPDNCAGTKSGDACQAICQAGFAGAPSALCNKGTWGAWDPVCTAARAF